MYRIRYSIKFCAIAFLSAAVCLFLLHCSVRKSNETEVVIARLGEEFELALGDFAAIEGTAFILSIDKVEYDIRCPEQEDCAWSGMAKLLATLSGDEEEYSLPLYIEGIVDSDRIPFLSTDTLGFNFQLLSLSPLAQASVEEKANPELLRARIRITESVERDSVDGIVEITDILPADIHQDQFELRSATVSDRTLQAVVSYSGGCERHFFYAYMTPSIFSGNSPREANLYIRHFNGFDECEAIVQDTLYFALESLVHWYESTYGELNPIKLNIFPFETEPNGEHLEVIFLQEEDPFNNPPAVDPIPQQSVVAGHELTFQVRASDPDGDQIDFELVEGPSSAEIVSRTPTSAFISYTPEPDFEGTVTFKVSATDGQKSVVASGTIVVYRPSLEINGPDEWTLRQGAADSVRFEVLYNGVGELEFSLLNAPANLAFSLEADTLLALYLQAPPEPGIREIHIFVTDGYYISTKLLTIHVSANAKPSLEVIDSLNLVEGSTDTIVAVASDPDGDDLELSVEGVPPFGTVVEKPESLLIILDAASAISEWNLKFTVSDGAWVVADSTYLRVEFRQDLPPSFTSTAPETVYVGVKLSWLIEVQDDHPEYLHIDVVDAPDGADVSFPSDSSILIEMLPTENMQGEYPVLIVASDAVNTTEFQSSIAVLPPGPNMMRFEEIPDQDMMETERVTVPVRVLNAPSDVVIELTEVENGGVLNDLGGGEAELTFTARLSSMGSREIELAATSGFLKIWTTVTFHISDYDPNPPVITSQSVYHTMTNVEFTTSIAIRDGDRERELPEVEVIGLPPGATYTTSGYSYTVYLHITYTPSVSDVGLHTFTIKATDPGPQELTSVQDVAIHVHELQESSGDMFPVGVGTRWVYEIEHSHIFCILVDDDDPSPNPPVLKCSSYKDTYTEEISIISREERDGFLWWNLSGELRGLGTSFAIRNDSVFVRRDTTKTLQFYKSDEKWYGYDWPDGFSEGDSVSAVVPYGAFVFAVSMPAGCIYCHSNYSILADNVEVDAVPGIGIVESFAEYIKQTSPSCTAGCWEDRWHARLIEFHPAPD